MIHLSNPTDGARARVTSNINYGLCVIMNPHRFIYLTEKPLCFRVTIVREAVLGEDAMAYGGTVYFCSILQ